MKLAEQLRKNLYKVPKPPETKKLTSELERLIEVKNLKREFKCQLNDKIKIEKNNPYSSDLLDFVIPNVEKFFNILDEMNNDWEAIQRPKTGFEEFVKYLKLEGFSINQINRHDSYNKDPLEFSKIYYLRVTW